MQRSAIFNSFQTKLSAQRLPFWAIRWSQLTEFSTSLAYRSVLNQIRLPKFDLRFPSLTTTKTQSASWTSKIRIFLIFSREVASRANSIRVTWNAYPARSASSFMFGRRRQERAKLVQTRLSAMEWTSRRLATAIGDQMRQIMTFIRVCGKKVALGETWPNLLAFVNEGTMESCAQIVTGRGLDLALLAVVNVLISSGICCPSSC